MLVMMLEYHQQSAGCDTLFGAGKSLKDNEKMRYLRRAIMRSPEKKIKFASFLDTFLCYDQISPIPNAYKTLKSNLVYFEMIKDSEDALLINSESANYVSPLFESKIYSNIVFFGSKIDDNHIPHEA